MLAALVPIVAACQLARPGAQARLSASNERVAAVQAPPAIPFGYALRAPSRRPTTAVSLHFELVEQKHGYDLNAVILDRSTGSLRTAKIRRCNTIDLDSFDASSRSLFATPVLCDGGSYSFDVLGERIAVVGPRRNYILQGLPLGHVMLNGVPVLVEPRGHRHPAPVWRDRSGRQIPFTIQ
ncbi:hypothetical protein [Aurantimonas marianensis]|uniref:Uncharacterized protein n=1 Tax=Aurantimonas marianensis TaxID=2920428 RepID=A0A9X2KE83_9HYPH|nr:hypothetical protein [Aurantimonas marianensis]MCP3055163.1 hypothetical protein [Aurantimonas marianensis]